MRGSLRRFCVVATTLLPLSAWAGTAVPFTINLSKAVNVVTSGGTPRIAVDVGGTTRYANYTSGSGTSALVFTYNMQAGDVDLDGVAVSSPVQLNGGTIKDLSGNPLTNLTFTPPNTSGIKVNYPSLGMDFTNGAGGRYTLNGTPYTTLASFLTAAGGSFTRASIGTYFDSAGVLQTATANTPRLDYDPVTHAAKGILIEESRTNLLARSSEFENAAWTANNTTVSSNSVVAPDGAMTADKITESSNPTAQHELISGLYTVGSGQDFTVSVFVKSAGRDRVALGFYERPNVYATVLFNLTTGQAYDNANPNSTIVANSIKDIGSGWYRLTVTAHHSVSASARLQMFVCNSTCDASYPQLVSYTGDGTSGIYVWGAQLEQGAFPTSYIPTTTAAVTRQGDVLSVPTGGWFSASSGTFYGQWDVSRYNGFQRILVSQPFTGSQIPVSVTGSSLAFHDGAWRVSGATVLAAGNSNKTGVAYGGTTASYSANGGSVASTPFDGGIAGSATAIVPFYDASFASEASTGHFQKLKFYPARVPNAQLQLMTQ